MTFSIVAADPEVDEIGVAVASRFLAAGAVVPWAAADAGAIATQALANMEYGPDGLRMLRSGAPPAEVVQRLVEPDPDREQRQVGVVDRAGRSAAHTGSACLPWAGHRLAEGATVQGNILAGPEVAEAMLASWHASGSHVRRVALADRLLAALRAGDLAGGDRRGRQSAALFVVRPDGGYGGRTDRALDLRVDDHPDPVAELARLRDLHRLYFERPVDDDLVAIDDALAVEIAGRLAQLSPGIRRAFPAGLDDLGLDRQDLEPPPIPSRRWTADRQRDLVTWMAVANLEERIVVPGWIDPVALAHLREVTDGSS